MLPARLVHTFGVEANFDDARVSRSFSTITSQLACSAARVFPGAIPNAPCRFNSSSTPQQLARPPWCLCARRQVASTRHGTGHNSELCVPIAHVHFCLFARKFFLCVIAWSTCGCREKSASAHICLPPVMHPSRTMASPANWRSPPQRNRYWPPAFRGPPRPCPVTCAILSLSGPGARSVAVSVPYFVSVSPPHPVFVCPVDETSWKLLGNRPETRCDLVMCANLSRIAWVGSNTSSSSRRRAVRCCK
jgi:hypothetical protein